ncbi:ATP-grasp domain-containing protein [Cerasibacillus terrae]|uniref:ATP-grasp domain-containing protein n=1 Tax=Cerasibacillus terrae TaxID=2498845 RepID=A0A5C8P0A2_9BACI|nr:ATP-grasp domain-containing protein [Cerasibacillus terrae]TXL66686.1 ATP-grasp domain-containing protein [Cerasibacillus terrae]
MKTIDIVGRKLSSSNRMLVREAWNRGINFEILPKKRFRMSHGSKRYLVRRGKVSHAYNSPLAIKTTRLKEVTSRLLRSSRYPAPENVVFSKEERYRAWNWAKPILPVVIKPYNGTMGRSVFVNIDNKKEFTACFDKVGEKYDHVLIEEFVDGEEYRFTFVKNEIVAVAKRIPANVVGDGKHTVEQLIEHKNEERKARKNPIHKQLVLDEESKRILKKHHLSPAYIPAIGEVVYLRDNSNVSTGGDAIDVTNQVDDDIKKGVAKAIRSIPGLRVCGVDVIIKGESFYILEVNSHPMLSMHHYPWEGERRDVIGKVLDGMFPQTAK